MPRFCSNCGSPLPDVGKFCPKCGHPMEADPVPQPDAYQPQPSQNQNQYSYQPNPSQNLSWQQPQNQGWQQAQSQAWQQPAMGTGMAPAPKKKSMVGLIIALVSLLLVALAAVACFIWPGFLKKDSQEIPKTTPTVSVPISTPEITENVPIVTTTVPVTETQPPEPTTTEPVVTELSNPFLDVVEDDPCYLEYLWAHEHGVIEGKLLDGEKALTRGEAINLLWKAFGRPTSEQNASPFSDVSVSDSFFPAVLWAYGSNLVSGNGDGTFHPNDPMTRNQAVAILCKAAGRNGAGLPRAYLDIETDQYFYASANWACSAGVVERYYDFCFRPYDPLLQADYVCWLARAVEPELALDPAPPKGDSLAEYGIEVNLHQHGVAYFAAQTKQDASITKRLSVTAESYEIFAEAEGYAAKDGYEWRRSVFLIGYGDADANAYSYSIYADVDDSYYVNLFEYYRKYNEDESETSWVVYNGVPCLIYVAPMIVEEVEGALYRVTYVVQVPIGYDGIVARFNSQENEAFDYDYFYDKYQDPADFVFFQYE